MRFLSVGFRQRNKGGRGEERDGDGAGEKKTIAVVIFNPTVVTIANLDYHGKKPSADSRGLEEFTSSSTSG